MKIKCTCGNEGFLETRGNSYRVKHYLGKVGNKRKYKTCSLKAIEANALGFSGNHTQIEVANSASFYQNKTNHGFPSLAVNQSVIGSSPIGGATPQAHLYCKNHHPFFFSSFS